MLDGRSFPSSTTTRSSTATTRSSLEIDESTSRRRFTSRVSAQMSGSLTLNFHGLGEQLMFGERRMTRLEFADLARLETTTESADFEEDHQPIRKSESPGAFVSMIQWATPRLGDQYSTPLFAGYVVSASVRLFLAQGEAETLRTAQTTANPASVMVASLTLSLCLGLVLAACNHGRAVIALLLNWHAAWRFMLISCLFTIAKVLNLGAMWLGASWSMIVTVGYVYLPASALLSVGIMRGLRVYGILEWLSLAILTFGTMAFVNLRMDAVAGSGLETAQLWSVAIVMLSASLSALGSVCAERIFKGRSSGANGNNNNSNARDEDVDGVDFVICKSHMDLASLVLCSLFWALPAPITKDAWRHNELWFGTWHAVDLLTVFSIASQGWLAGLFVKRFSTVLRGITDTLVTVHCIVVLNPLLLGDSRFKAGSIPCMLLTLIVSLAAMIFQTGRLNIRFFRSRLSFQPNIVTPSWRVPDEPVAALKTCVKTYGAMIIFVLADAARTLSQQQALSRSMITPMSMALAAYLSGIVVATTTILTSSTSEDRLTFLKQAFNLRRVLRYLPCAAFFALASTAQCMAYATGVSAAVATALGYVYMPLSALVSRWVLGKYYIWLEWFSLLMLTFASAAFGFLQHHFSNLGRPDQESSAFGVILVLSSAIASVLGSLTAEKVLKEEDLPFHVQKVSLDMGSLLSTLMLFPIVGAISSRPQDAFWKLRPLSGTCGDALCWSGEGCSNPACGCECGSGFFVAWNNWLVLFALLVSIAQGWLTGMIIKKFSTVLRAIAQSSTILVIYFIGDPLLCDHCAMNWPLTLIAILVPLSTATFMVAVQEMEKVLQRTRTCC